MKKDSNKPSMTVRLVCGILVGALLLTTVVLVLSLVL